MKVVAISGSPRKNGNTDIVISKILEGMGIPDQKIIKVNDLDFSGCQACYACREEGADGCILNDDMRLIYPEIIDADVLIIGSPIYYGYLTGQLKCFIDRWYAFRDSDRKLRFDEGKRCVFVLVQGAPGRERYKEVITDMRHIFTKYGMELKVIVADGVEEKGSVLRKDDILEEAFFRGKELKMSLLN
jgi:multimeric flavodoxin WrbA